MSQESKKSIKKSNIYFVISRKKESNENMMHTYHRCLEDGVEPVWISEKDSNEMKLMKSDTLVVEDSEESSRDQATTSRCCTTRGTVCAGVMQDLCICTSGLCAKDETQIQILVKTMSGNFTTDLDDKVTHLVTSSVLSIEYEKAIHMKIQIVTEEWVKAIWNANETDYVKPDDKRFDKYKVSMFYNLVVTTANIQKYETEEIAHLIKNNGGMYMSDLDVEKVNIVLAPENSQLSQTLKNARESNIICLTLNWVYESIKVGHALPFRYYRFQTVEENYSSRRSNVSTVTTVLDRLMFNEAEAAGPFLYDCIISLAGFTSDQMDKLNKIVDVVNAMRFVYICDILTHIIVGDKDSAANELKLLKSAGLCPYLLTLEWLEESIRLKWPAPVENFLYEQKNSTLQKVTEPSSSLIKNSQLLQDRMSEEGEESSNLGQQELQNAIVSTTDETAEYIPALARTPDILDGYLIPPKTDNCDIINGRLFEGLIFVVSSLCETYNDLVEKVARMSGRIVPGTFFKIPDYGVVPKHGTVLDCIVNEIVTNLFIIDCINQDRIVEIMYYHRPIYGTSSVLLGCVLTISKYIGVERSYLITLAMALGAIYQDVFAHETIIEKPIYKSTNLVCSIPEGEKYNAAVRCKIPVVTANWLIACAVQSRWVDETPFLVVKSLVPSKELERPVESDISLPQSNIDQIIISTEPVASNSRNYNIIVPEEYFSNLKIQINTFDNTLLPNNELSLPMNTTSEPSETLYNHAFGPILSLKTKKPRLEGISYTSNLIKKKPPLQRLFRKGISIFKRNWQKVNKKLPENHNADEILPAAAKDTDDDGKTDK